MTYPLNTEALTKLGEYRKVAFEQNWRTSTGKKFKRWNEAADKIARARFIKVPEHVQMKMALKAIRLRWESVWVPTNTWDFDKEDAPKRLKEVIAPESLAVIDQTIKEIPKHNPKQAEASSKKTARAALDAIKNMESLIEGSDRDPKWANK